MSSIELEENETVEPELDVNAEEAVVAKTPEKEALRLKKLQEDFIKSKKRVKLNETTFGYENE